MQIHDLTQGTPEWQQYRLDMFGASEAAAMLGISSLVTRTQLLHMKATGTAQEFSDWVQANILDHGHRVEALARPLVEELIDQDLYPVTCSDGRLSASCDGLTMGEDIAFEHKQWNQALAAAVAAGQLPDEYMPQCQQIMMVTGAAKVIFVCSDGTRDNLVYLWVQPDATWQARLRAGWKQFEADLAEYQHVEVLPPPVAAPVQDLPALSIRVDGELTLNHNLTLFGAKLQAFVDDIDTNPSDDQAFADAEQAIKVLDRAESALGAAEASALGQVSAVDDMVRTVATYRDLARKTRLMLEKVVKARKETIRVEIQQAAKGKADAHIAALNARLGKPYMPAVFADFAGVMKGKKTVSSLRDAVDTELARFKIEANAVADRIQINLGVLRELASAHAFLFADASTIVLKAADDLAALVKLRIAEHEQAKAAEAEALRAKIAEEERVKAEKAAADAERARVAAETKRQLEEQAAAVAAARAREEAVAREAVSSAAPAPAAEHVAGTFDFQEPLTAPAQVTSIDAARAPSQADDDAMLRLGQINERLAPITLTAEGLSRLGFAHALTDKAAKLYRESDFLRICAALQRHISAVAQAKAA